MDLLWFIALCVIARWAWTARSDARRANERTRELHSELVALREEFRNLSPAAGTPPPARPSEAQSAGDAQLAAAPATPPDAPLPEAPLPETPLPEAPEPVRAAEREPLIARTAAPAPATEDSSD